MLSDVAWLILLIVNAFVAITAIGGGIALSSGLEARRFSPELLDGTPFRSYRVPGLLLAGVVGGSAAAATVLVALSGDGLGAGVSVLAGLVLCGWILFEIRWLDRPRESSMELAYLGLGGAMIVLGIIVAGA